MKVLMILTSHDTLGDTGEKTGFWLEEFAAPYYVFRDAGADVTLASPAGGQPPVDPKSADPDAQTEATRRFDGDDAAKAALGATHKLSDISAGDFDLVFYPGGHGPLWDLAEDTDSIRLIETAHAAGTPVALVCHAPAVLRHVKDETGAPLVASKTMTGFTNEEEAAVGLTNVVPFLLEDELRALGADFRTAEAFAVHVLCDGHLVTGQNPPSSADTARRALDLLRLRAA